MTLTTDQGTNDYSFRLSQAAGDTLVFLDERAQYAGQGHKGPPRSFNFGAGHRESQLIARAEGGGQTAATILVLLRRSIVHQFHNTAATARMRNKWPLSDNRRLKEDAGDLAAFLCRL